jgi:uracil phosphoribosyltransferase
MDSSGNLHIVNHPVIQHKLTKLRKKSTTPKAYVP